MVEAGRFELQTFRTSSERSNQLSYASEQIGIILPRILMKVKVFSVSAEKKSCGDSESLRFAEFSS